MKLLFSAVAIILTFVFICHSVDGYRADYKREETAHILCNEKEVIRVSSVKKRGKDCGINCNPTQDVRNVCDGERSCKFAVDTEFFGKRCTLNKAGIILQYKCISDPCSAFCCANGGKCQLTDPKGNNFDPKCFCIQGYDGDNCEDCDLNRFPCNWRNRTYDIYTPAGTHVATMFFTPDGTRRISGSGSIFELVKILGSFIILRKTADGRYFCFKIDFSQSSNNTFIYRASYSSDSEDPCIACTRNKNASLREAIAQDSGLLPRQSINTFCDSPVGCVTTGVECDDNGSLDFNEGCPE